MFGMNPHRKLHKKFENVKSFPPPLILLQVNRLKLIQNGRNFVHSLKSPKIIDF